MSTELGWSKSESVSGLASGLYINCKVVQCVVSQQKSEIFGYKSGCPTAKFDFPGQADIP
jgi:hypothetical protein